jgi:hypothetical protein
MCKVNVTEFRKNIFHYIELCSSEEVHVTKNGEVVAVLSNPDNSYYKALYRLCGSLADVDNGKDYKEMIGEEILKKCDY